MDELFKTIALVSVWFGLRISECPALKWLDLDWFNRTLSIQRATVRQRLDDVKTMYSERSMAIDAAMLDAEKRWKQTSQFPKPEDWMFASPAKLGRLPWSADAVNDACLKAAKLAGTGHVSTHSMRHTYRSWLDAVGTADCRTAEVDAARGHPHDDEHLWGGSHYEMKASALEGGSARYSTSQLISERFRGP